MMLRDDIYSVTECGKNTGFAVYHISLNPCHAIFKAHFPGEPVTPGVCLIQMGRELAEDFIGRQMILKLLKNVKFLSVVSPLVTPEFCFHITKLTYSESGDEVTVMMNAEADGKPLLKMSFVAIIR